MPRRSVTLPEVLEAHAGAERAATYRVMPGIVVAYHAAAAGASPPTVDVQPAVHDPRGDTETGERVSEPWPVLPDVPVAWPRIGPFVVAGRLRAGDHVLLLAFDLDPSSHFATGLEADPVDVRRHGGNYWLAIPWDLTDPGALADPGDDALVVGIPGGSQVRVTSTGVALGAAAPSDAVALASVVDANFTSVKTTLTSLQTAVAAMAALFNAVAGPMNSGGAGTVAAAAAPGTPAAVGSATVKVTP